MELRIPHPEVSKLLNGLNNYTRASISFNKQSQCLELLQSLIIDSLAKGKKIAVVTSASNSQNLIKNDLSELGLANLSLTVNANEGIFKAEDLNFSRILRDHQTKSIDINFLRHIQTLTSNYKTSLQHSYDAMDKEVIEDLSWQSLVDYKALLNRDGWTTLLDQKIDETKFNWSLDELMQLRNDLQTKVTNFRMHYTSLKELDPFKAGFYQSIKEEKEIDDRIEYFYTLMEKLKEVQLDIKDLAERERTMAKADSSIVFNQVKQACNELFRLKSLIIYLKNKQKTNPLKTGLLGFEKDPLVKQIATIEEDIKTQISTIKQYTTINTLNMNNFESIDIAGIKNQLEDIFVYQADEEDSVLFNIDEQISEIKNLYFGINSKEWLNRTFKISKKHHDDVIQDVNEIIFQLQKSINFIINNNDFILWSIDSNANPENSEALQQIVEPLIQIDSEEWCDIFENWYLLKILNKNFSHHFAEAFDYESFTQHLLLEQQTKIDYIQHYWRQQKLWADKTYEDMQSEIRRMLHSQINRLNVEVALASWGKLIATYFPITLIDEKKLVNNKDLLSTWDYIIVLEGSDLIEMVGNNKLATGKKFVAIQSISNHAYKKTDFNMVAEGFYQQNKKEINLLENSRIFSKELCKFGLPTKVYQNQQSIFISYWTQAKNGLLERLIGDVQEVNLGDNPVEILQDIFTQEKKDLIVLIQDGLFNLNRTDRFEQIDVIELMKMNNIQFKNVWSKDYYLIGKDLITSLLADLIIEKDKPKQKPEYTTENYVA